MMETRITSRKNPLIQQVRRLLTSKKERETMNKKPYYRQTAIVFFLMGITSLLIGFAILFDAGWITYIAGVVIIIILIYAITSSIAIEKSKKQR